jgi:DNA-directed RNA polymerase subunit alpha
MIPCPECNALGHKVLESRYQLKLKAKRRRCVCKACGFRFTTQEKVWTGEHLSVVPAEPAPLSTAARLDQIEARLEALIAAKVQESTQPAPEPTVASVPIERLDLRTVRAYNTLKRAGVSTVDHLLNLTPADLLRIKRFGVTSLADVVEALERLGLELPREASA